MLFICKIICKTTAVCATWASSKRCLTMSNVGNGGGKELKSMCLQVKSQVFTGYCTMLICVLGLKPNHVDCLE